MYPKHPKFLTAFFAISLTLTACNQPTKTTETTATAQTTSDDIFAGCYTVSPSEPAQIKINHEKTAQGDKYSMQMREFNDPNKGWDTPTPMQVIANNSSEISQYFDIKADEHQFVEKVISREDKMFVLAKITDSFARLNPQFDSNYLGFIYKGSNTVFKVNCENTTQL